MGLFIFIVVVAFIIYKVKKRNKATKAESEKYNEDIRWWAAENCVETGGEYAWQNLNGFDAAKLIKVAGVTKTPGDARSVYKALKAGDILTLQQEPDNPVDEKAIKVLYKGVQLGYVARADYEIINKCISKGANFEAEVIYTKKSKYVEFPKIDIVAYATNLNEIIPTIPYFKNKEVVVCGEWFIKKSIDKKSIKRILNASGANIGNVISKKTEIAILGSSPTEHQVNKLQQAAKDGQNIEVVSSKQLLSIISESTNSADELIDFMAMIN